MRPLSRFSSNRTIIHVGLLIAVIGAVVVALLLGVFDRFGWMS
jgi:hypothetical protein